MCDVGERARAGGEGHARLVRGARRAARVRHRQRVHRRHHGPRAVPRAHQALPLSEGKFLDILRTAQNIVTN